MTESNFTNTDLQEIRSSGDSCTAISNYLYNQGLDKISQEIKPEDVVVASALKENVSGFKRILEIAGNEDCKAVTILTINNNFLKGIKNADIRMNIADSLQSNLGIFCAASTLSDNIVIDAKADYVLERIRNSYQYIKDDMELIGKNKYEKKSLETGRLEKSRQRPQTWTKA